MSQALFWTLGIQCWVYPCCCWASIPAGKTDSTCTSKYMCSIHTVTNWQKEIKQSDQGRECTEEVGKRSATLAGKFREVSRWLSSQGDETCQLWRSGLRAFQVRMDYCSTRVLSLACWRDSRKARWLKYSITRWSQRRRCRPAHISSLQDTQ